MSLTEQQKQAATSATSVAITAGAGTGKTYMLAQRYLFHLQQGLSPLEIVAMTFTDKAALELRSRIRQTVKQQAPERWDWLAELEAAPICTFHSLASQICREHPSAAGVPADFTPLDEWEGQLWQAEQVLMALDRLPDSLYDQIPYSLMKAALDVFLKDPLSAEEALQRSREDWLPILQKTQGAIIETLITHSTWQDKQAIISQYAGKPGDKLEDARQNSLVLAKIIANYNDRIHTQDFQTALKNFICQRKVTNIGAKGNWQNPKELTIVREALNELIDLAREKCVPHYTRDKEWKSKELENSLICINFGEPDEQMEAMLPALREAFALIRQFLTEAKRKQRRLDFNDLEFHALQALAKPEIRDYYQQRWQAFLIDEFQDTNPTQGKLLEVLTQGKILTLVGDEKQSIYGFRRADIQVFQQWRERLGNTIPLSVSFRTHSPLIENINQIFAPILGELHQNLGAQRREPPHPAPHLESFIIDPNANGAAKLNTEQLCQEEARHIAGLIQGMLEEKRPVWDKKTREHRPIEPRDIAILARTWKPLEIYGQAIADLEIPVLQAGGGNLLDTREAKDGVALLRFLADSRDDIALVAVLRSPFFAWSDRLLLTLRQAAPEDQTWWQVLQNFHEPMAVQAVEIFKELRRHRQIDPPSRLLQLADRLTGYTAVIANLPNCRRRLADWQGFLDTVRRLEAGSYETFTVARRLKRLMDNDVEIKRPPLEAGNAITLMTIHGAKGLEWPVVIVADLSRKPLNNSAKVCFDPQLGVALKQEDDSGEQQKSALYLLLEQRQKKQDREEMKRLLYVAATRAGDRLIFTTGQGDQGANLWQLLQAGLQGEFNPQVVDCQPEIVSYLHPPAPPLPELPAQILTHSLFGGLQLPVTSLTDYARCPKQFQYKHMDGHPGDVRGAGNQGPEIGILTHRILARNIQAISEITPPENLTREQAEEALQLAEAFRNNPLYASVQSGHWERRLSLTIGKIRFHGAADLVGDDFILDIKTEQEQNPQEHRFQVWAYAKALKKTKAYIAYLRQLDLFTFPPEELQTLDQEAEALISALANKKFTPNPSVKNCRYCPYTDICEEAMINPASTNSAGG